MLVAALGALYAFGTAVTATAHASAETQQVEGWRALGLAFFVGLFVLLALSPRRFAGIWELAILDKAVLTIVQAFIIVDAKGARDAAVADGILTALLIAAYVLSRGYAAWGRERG
ncbi:MAG: hypothetical protein ACHQ7M_13410 [Chloroflexota bacterium]